MQLHGGTENSLWHEPKGGIENSRVSSKHLLLGDCSRKVPLVDKAEYTGYLDTEEAGVKCILLHGEDLTMDEVSRSED